MPKSKMRKLAYIKGFGFEIEGGWKPERYRKIREEKLMKGDGSVRVASGHEPGEINSPVYKDFKMAWEFMRDYYPDTVNETCGFHVHISVKDSDYVRLMEKSFHEAFLKWSEGIEKKYNKIIPATFKSRKAGENKYCRTLFIPEQQARGTGDRYTQLNFCYTTHKTLENRMLPGCPKAETAFFLMTQYLLMVENFLKKTPNKMNAITVEIKEPEIGEEKKNKIKDEIGEIILCA